MRLAIAAALALAVGLIAAPSFAATSSTAGTPAETAANPPMKHVTHHKVAHRGTMHAMASPTVAEHPRVEQLNEMSLQAAKKGESMTPPAGAPSAGQK
jgi:hypothetical protein